MLQREYNLAIETSGPIGTLAIGRGDTLIVSAQVPQKRRHHIDLVATIDQHFRAHGLTAGQLAEVYVSLGPGSFTGLRIGIATAKMLALAGAVKLIGVPTIAALQIEHPHAMICLNVKRGTAYSAGPGHKPRLRTLEEILATGLPIISDTIEGATPAAPRGETIWHLGRKRSARGQFDDPAQLAPLYIREPEAVTLWDQREREQQK